MTQEIPKNDPKRHASQVMHHLEKLNDRNILEHAEDEEAAKRAARMVEDLYMDIDDAMYAVREACE